MLFDNRRTGQEESGALPLPCFSLCVGGQLFEERTRHTNICPGKVVALEKERLSQGARERIAAAVAQVQTRGVVALPILFVSRPGQQDLVSLQADDRDSCGMKKQIELTDSRRTLARGSRWPLRESKGR